MTLTIIIAVLWALFGPNWHSSVAVAALNAMPLMFVGILCSIRGVIRRISAKPKTE